MRKCFWIPAIVAVAMMTVACEKNGGETPGPGPDKGDDSTTTTDIPVLTLTSESEMQIGHEGGPLTITYTLENGVENGRILASPGGANWIKQLDYSVDGTVTFNVVANQEMEARETVITITYLYGGTTDVKQGVKIVQGAFSYDYEVEAASVTGDYWGGQNTMNASSEMEYELHLSDASKAHNYVFHLYSVMPENLEAPAPPAGTYNLDTEDLTNHWTISRYLSGFYTTDEASAIRFEEARVVITKDGDNYTYLMHMTDADGKTHQVTYTGPVALTNQDRTCISTLEGDLELNIANGEASIGAIYYASRNYEGVSQWAISLNFAESAKNSWCYQIHLLLPESNTFADGITPGEYPVNASRGANTVVAGWLDEDNWIMGAWAYDLYYNEGSPRGPMASGTVKIEVDEDGIYTFTVNCQDDNRENPNSITGVISGVPTLENPFNL